MGDNQSSMDVDLACNHSDKERPSSDSTEILSAVTLGKLACTVILFVFGYLVLNFIIDCQLLDL